MASILGPRRFEVIEDREKFERELVSYPGIGWRICESRCLPTGNRCAVGALVWRGYECCNLA